VTEFCKYNMKELMRNYMRGCDMKNKAVRRIQEERKYAVSKEVVMRIAYGVLKGLNYLH